MAYQAFRARSQELLRNNKLLIIAELIIAVLIVVGGFVPVSSTPVIFLFGWLSLWLRGQGWRAVGFTPPANWGRALLFGIVFGVAYQVFSLYALEPLMMWFGGEPPDLGHFAALRGNITFLLVMLALSWSLAAFGEELVFRGYLLNRIAELANRSRAGWALGLVATSVLFGIPHLYQGVSGAIIAGLLGLAVGALYLASGRNLWVPIIAHGVLDTTGFALIFFGSHPGQ